MNPLVLTFSAEGIARCLYSELIDLQTLGSLDIQRASTIEFDQKHQRWELRDPKGKLLCFHRSRAACVTWEHEHFNR